MTGGPRIGANLTLTRSRRVTHRIRNAFMVERALMRGFDIRGSSRTDHLN